VSVSIEKRGVLGDQRYSVVTVTGPQTYTSTGINLTPAAFGLEVIDVVTSSPASTGYVLAYDYTNQKGFVLKGNGTNALNQVADSTDLRTTSFRLQVVGR
jgi:hypothetical protein